MDATMNQKRNKGGVEERKEDDYDQSAPLPKLLSSDSPKVKSTTEAKDRRDDDAQSGFGASVESFAKTILGACGQAAEAASYMAQGQCRWPGNQSPTRDKGAKPALSIADELRKLAQKEGRPFLTPPVSYERVADIPKFLGEDAVYSFEDDNISAISQHTLEEMMVARNEVLHPMCRKPRSSNSLHTPPSPTRTTSLSTSSSDKRRRSRQKDERSI
jgi:hypothetical protein